MPTSFADRRVQTGVLDSQRRIGTSIRTYHYQDARLAGKNDIIDAGVINIVLFASHPWVGRVAIHASVVDHQVRTWEVVVQDRAKSIVDIVVVEDAQKRKREMK